MYIKFFKPLFIKDGEERSDKLEIIEHLRSSRCVCIFPDKNTEDSIANTGQFVKRAGVPLITYRLMGKDLPSGRLVNVYTNDMIEEMSASELAKALKTDLYV